MRGFNSISVASLNPIGPVNDAVAKLHPGLSEFSGSGTWATLGAASVLAGTAIGVAHFKGSKTELDIEVAGEGGGASIGNAYYRSGIVRAAAGALALTALTYGIGSYAFDRAEPEQVGTELLARDIRFVLDTSAQTTVELPGGGTSLAADGVNTILDLSSRTGESVTTTAYVAGSADSTTAKRAGAVRGQLGAQDVIDFFNGDAVSGTESYLSTQANRPLESDITGVLGVVREDLRANSGDDRSVVVILTPDGSGDQGRQSISNFAKGVGDVADVHVVAAGRDGVEFDFDTRVERTNVSIDGYTSAVSVHTAPDAASLENAMETIVGQSVEIETREPYNGFKAWTQYAGVVFAVSSLAAIIRVPSWVSRGNKLLRNRR